MQDLMLLHYQFLSTISQQELINLNIQISISLSSIADNLEPGIHKLKCKYFSCFLEYESINDKYKLLN